MSNKDFGAEWDAKMDKHDRAVKQGRKMAFQEVLLRIELLGFESVDHVVGDLVGRLEEIEGEEYEAAAKLDHITDGPF